MILLGLASEREMKESSLIKVSYICKNGAFFMSEIFLSHPAFFVIPIAILIVLVIGAANDTAAIVAMLLLPFVVLPIGSSIDSVSIAQRRALAESYIQETMSRYACLDDVEGFDDDEETLRVKESGRNYKIIVLEKKTGKLPDTVKFTIKDDYSYTVNGF